MQTIKRYIGNRWQTKAVEGDHSKLFNTWLFKTKANQGEALDQTVKVMWGAREWTFHKAGLGDKGLDGFVDMLKGVPHPDNRPVIDPIPLENSTQPITVTWHGRTHHLSPISETFEAPIADEVAETNVTGSATVLDITDEPLDISPETYPRGYGSEDSGDVVSVNVKTMNVPDTKPYSDFRESVRSVLSKASSTKGGRLGQTTIENYTSEAVRAWFWMYPNTKPKPWVFTMKWLNMDYENVYDYITKTYAGSTVTIGNKVSNLSAVALHFDLPDAYAFFKAKSSESKVIREKDYKEGKVAKTVAKNFVRFEDLETRVKTELMPPFNKLCKEGRTVATDAEFKIMSDALLGVMNVIAPNCRNVLHSARFAIKPPTQKMLDKGDRNYIHVDKHCNVWLYVCKDKVMKSMGPDYWQLEDDVAKVVIASMHLMPRRWLFPRGLKDDEMLESTTYTDRIRALFTFKSADGTVRRAGDRVIRHAQVSHFYKLKPSPSVKEKEWMSRRLRHTPETMEKIYWTFNENMRHDLPILAELGEDDLPDEKCPPPPKPIPEEEQATPASSPEATPEPASELGPSTPPQQEATKTTKQQRYLSKPENKAKHKQRVKEQYEKNKMVIGAKQLYAKWNAGLSKPTQKALDKYSAYIGQRKDGSFYWKDQ